MFNPRYQLTNAILNSLTKIVADKTIIDRARILPAAEIKLRRQAILRMAHSSTAIEGNQLNLPQVEAIYAHKRINASKRDIYEVKNYIRALKYIEKVVLKKKPLNEKIILKIHKLVTENVLPNNESGKYRQGPVYIVRRRPGLSDLLLYTAPLYKKVPYLVGRLIKWLNNQTIDKLNPVITSAICHKEIAAIHPFSDGNGRTARALATLILYSRGYDFQRLFALEDYYNENRSAYYQAINTGTKYNINDDLTKWIEYFVLGFQWEINEVKLKIMSFSSKKKVVIGEKQIYLSPNQQKILEFIDQLGKITIKDAVDILSVPRRSAQLELFKLKKLGFIKQLKKGPAAYYI